jgi:SAM-dependent methyltransferase
VRTLGAVKEYYDTRAPEYDDWYLGVGLFAERDRPGWDEDVCALERAVAELPAARTLDVACGTGFLTRHLLGAVTGLDQSARMLELARERAPGATFVQADALDLPFEDGAFERVFTGHFYGHLDPWQRELFLAEARRGAPELVVVDAIARKDRAREGWQERILEDGSRWRVYKRYFEPEQVATELGGGEVLHSSRWFVMVRHESPVLQRETLNRGLPAGQRIYQVRA